jgi:hypothetical protein
MSSPTEHEPATLLEQWWSEYTQTSDEHDVLSVEDRIAETAPFGQQWPGLAPSPTPEADPAMRAASYAESMVAGNPALRLGLVAADRGADALAVVGWTGATNYVSDAGHIAAVLRGWEERFGVRLVAAGFAELYMSVAAPPTTHEAALRVAAEHFALCPDNIWQGSEPCTLAGYADRLVGTPAWAFWWD